jgi:hypothetical protein
MIWFAVQLFHILLLFFGLSLCVLLYATLCPLCYVCYIVLGIITYTASTRTDKRLYQNIYPVLVRYPNSCLLAIRPLEDADGAVKQGRDRGSWYCSWASAAGR